MSIDEILQIIKAFFDALLSIINALKGKGTDDSQETTV